MKKEKVWKHLRVEEGTHKRVKGLAGLKGIGIDEVIVFLLEELKNKGVQNASSDYRKR